MRWRSLILALGALLVVLGWQADLAAQEGKLPVAASIVPLADFCRQLGGDRVEVQLLIPPGASPHTFEPSPGLLSQLNRAKVVVLNGAGLEPWVTRFLRTLKPPTPVVVEAVAGLDLIREVPEQVLAGPSPTADKAKERHDHQHGHHHHHGEVNPHVWLDPVLAQDICRRIAGALSAADPNGKEYYEARLQQFLGRLQELHERLAAATVQFTVKEYIGFHPSFTYFARRYGLQEVGIIEVSPGREPTPKAMQRLIDAVKSRGIRAIFAEPQFNPRLAEALAREAGVKIALVDPLGGRPPYGDSYLALMAYNLETMAQAMK